MSKPLLRITGEHFVDSPESLLKTIAKLSGAHFPADDFPIDALSSTLQRAAALTVVVHSNVDGDGNLSNEVLANVVWALQGLICEAQTILDVWHTGLVVDPWRVKP